MTSEIQLHLETENYVLPILSWFDMFLSNLISRQLRSFLQKKLTKF